MTVTTRTLPTLLQDNINTGEDIHVEISKDEDICVVSLGGNRYNADDFLELAKLVEFLK